MYHYYFFWPDYGLVKTVEEFMTLGAAPHTTCYEENGWQW